jgi:hypothetical protein
VLTLKKNMYTYQFGQYAWTHMILMVSVCVRCLFGRVCVRDVLHAPVGWAMEAWTHMILMVRGRGVGEGKRVGEWVCGLWNSRSHSVPQLAEAWPAAAHAPALVNPRLWPACEAC